MVSRIRLRLASNVCDCYGSLPPVVLSVLYSAFVMSLFAMYDYCDIAWGGWGLKILNFTITYYIYTY